MPFRGAIIIFLKIFQMGEMFNGFITLNLFQCIFRIHFIKVK